MMCTRGEDAGEKEGWKQQDTVPHSRAGACCGAPNQIGRKPLTQSPNVHRRPVDFALKQKLGRAVARCAHDAAAVQELQG